MRGSSDGTYRGAIGAFPYAFRVSESRLFRSYVVVSALVALLVILLFTGAVVVAFGNTFQAPGGTFTFSRAFVAFVGFALVAPMVAPVLFVARRHRREGGSPGGYDRVMATAGYAFVASIYVALLISAPAELRETPPAVVAPVVEFLYGLPQVAGLVPLVLAGVAIYLVHRRYR